MKQVFTLSPTGTRRVVPNYFAAISGSVLGAHWQPANPRTEPVLVFKKHGKTCLEVGDFIHLIKVVTDFPNPTYSTDRRTITTPNALRIDSVAVEQGDRIEMPSAIATGLNVAPGIWIADSDRQITLEKAPVYSLSSAWDCGAPWAWRLDTATGEMVGLAPITFNITSSLNKNKSAQIKNAWKIFDTDFWSQGDHSLISWAGYRIDFASVTVRRMALYTRSVRVPGESWKPSRFRVYDPNGGHMTGLFYNYDTGVKASGEYYTFALASTETWATLEMNRSLSALSFDDLDNSRGYTSICSYGDLACQVSIKGVIPATGSTIEISEAVADGFFPKIEAGTYNLTENASGQQWRLKKQ